MKVLICIPCLMTGGTEIQTLNLVQALIKDKHQVITVCYFEYSASMVNKYIEAGSEVIFLHPSGKRIGGKAGVLSLYKGLRQVIKKHKPDVAHVQYMAPGAIPILLLRLLGMKQILATAHTAADIYPNLKIVHLIQKYCVRAFTCITLRAEESFFGTAQLYTQGMTLRKRNHFTIHNALPGYISIRQVEKEFVHPTIIIGVVSRLEKIKGMDLVIPAFHSIRNEHPHTQLLIVGDGSLRAEMEQQAEELGIEDIIWQGRQAQENLKALYDQIDILLMPSRSEGFGLTAIEGMARGCVVVASDTGGLPEVVKDGETGLLHQAESIEDMGMKISQLLNTKELLIKLSGNAVRNAQQYSFKKYAALFADVYNQIQ